MTWAFSPTDVDDPNSATARLLEAVVGAAMDAIVALDAEQRIVLFNPAAEAMFRCSATEAIGQSVDRFLPPSYREKHRHQVDAFMRSGETTRTARVLPAFKGVRGDGEEFPIEVSIARAPLDGQIHAVAVIRDITIRQDRESALRQRGDLLDLAYDAIFTWDRSGTITYWNRGAERLYGYSGAAAIGSNCQDLLHTRCDGGFTAVLATLEREGNWEGELIHTCRDGRDVAVACRLSTVNGSDGQYEMVLEVADDVSAEKEAAANEALSRQREATAHAAAEAATAARDRLQSILNGLPGGVLLINAPTGEIEFANTAMLELMQCEGRHDASCPRIADVAFLQFDGTSLKPDLQPVARAMRGERVHHQQLRLLRGDGTTIPVEVFAAPLGLRHGLPTGVVVNVQDISLLVQAEQFKDDFLALLSHELRTPLTAIQGGARLLANKPDLDQTTRDELLQDIAAESQRLDRLLSNLLLVTHVQAGRLHVATEPTPVAALARGVIARLADQHAAHTFVVNAGSNLAVVEADPDLLEEILRNLYENAIKYSPAGGEIATRMCTDGDTVVIRISDEGIGIAPEYVGLVFERFRRIGADPTIRGMGLGLYLSRALVTAQNGQIEASSPGVGQGATFTVRLPAAREGAPPLGE